MGIFEMMEKEGHEQLIFLHDKLSGLKAAVGIHDTTLGPALGGCRMWPYPTEEEMVKDVLRLSKGMTAKSAATGCDYGGGKAVIWGNPNTDKSEELFRAFGRFVEGLRGRFITGTDMGTNYEDFVWAAQESKYFVALPESHGGSGDSSLITAYGVTVGIKTALRFAGSDNLKGKGIAIQGVGKVGYHLIENLLAEGARIYASDISESKLDEIRKDFPEVTIVSPEEIYGLDVDVFSPCAMGGIINDETIKLIKAKIIAGSANNQLLEPRHGEMLRQRGILYAPDFIVNAGGLIQVVDELSGFDRERAMRKTAGIRELLMRVFEISKDRDIPTNEAAAVLVEERIARLGALQRIYLSK